MTTDKNPARYNNEVDRSEYARKPEKEARMRMKVWQQALGEKLLAAHAEVADLGWLRSAIRDSAAGAQGCRIVKGPDGAERLEPQPMRPETRAQFQNIYLRSVERAAQVGMDVSQALTFENVTINIPMPGEGCGDGAAES